MALKIGIIGAGLAGLVTALALEAYCKSGETVEIITTFCKRETNLKISL